MSAAGHLYHYTIGNYLPAIVTHGEIVPATALVPRGVRPAVWCSTNQDWEPTATKGSNVWSTHRHGGSLARIEIDPAAAPHSWADYKRESGERPKMIARLSAAARSVGADPQDWRVSFDPIPRESWLSIEVFSRGRWVAYETGSSDQ